MDDVLLGIVLDRLTDTPLKPEAEALLLAALEGDQALAVQLTGEAAGRPSRPAASPVPRHDPAGAYLRSVTVTGFRGIGPAATLAVSPGPGLTLVVGRNGSGKSSFAEALEALLTGTVARMARAPQPVREGWPSKHAHGATEITAEFLVEGRGKALVSRRWPAGTTDIARSAEWLQVTGQKRESLAVLGWDAGLATYRPFLSHAELEAFFGRPSDLHDLLASVLGLDDLTGADKRLNAARKEREDALTAVKNRLGPLRGRLEPLAQRDERAGQCLSALAGASPAKWDIPAARAAATGGESADDSQLAVLRRLTQLAQPPRADVDAAVAGLHAAAGALRDVAGTDAERARDLVRLLDAALGHHAAHGDGDCPVCGSPGALTSQWRQATSQHRDRLSEQAAAADAASARAKTAVSSALALLLPPPLILVAPQVGGAGRPDMTAAMGAWQQWTSPELGQDGAEPPPDTITTPEELTALAGHLTTAYPVLASAVAELAAAAAAELASRDNQWAPVAADIAAWCGDAELAVAGSQPVAALKDARKWLNAATGSLREERLAPLADQSRSIWSELRQESNVSLGAFRLSGVNTTRRLDLDVSVDGEPGTALGTMSQGEINALALSVFLPRATMPESPFNFLVIDDPVQAMDPAKVDGLARVLATVAAGRQVIVFTHDNRLAAAVRDLSIPAAILEVTRQPRSNVTVRGCLDASRQALSDAGAVGADEKVPAAVAARVIPGLCRTAVEAAFAEAYWRQQLRAGRTRAEIEATLDGKNLRLSRIAALAVLGNADDGHRAGDEIGRRWGWSFGETMKALNRGSHQGHDGDLGYLVSDSRKLVAEIEARLR